MTDNGIIKINGKDYMTVARRLELAREDDAIEGVETDVLSFDPVVIRAKVTVKGKVWTGISSVSLDSSKYIDKQNPYEVAETSAVGRALGFAGFGVIESIASADEMAKAGAARKDSAEQFEQDMHAALAKKGVLTEEELMKESVDESLHGTPDHDDEIKDTVDAPAGTPPCPQCGSPTELRAGTSKAGKPYKGYFCTGPDRQDHKPQWA